MIKAKVNHPALEAVDYNNLPKLVQVVIKRPNGSSNIFVVIMSFTRQDTFDGVCVYSDPSNDVGIEVGEYHTWNKIDAKPFTGSITLSNS